MDVFQFVLAVLAIVVPVVGAVGYVMRRYADGRYIEIESRLKAADAISAQAVSASESIKTLTGALMGMVDERRESTVATKDNTVATKESVEAVKALSTSIDGLGKDRGEALTVLTGAVTSLTTVLTESLTALLKSQAEAVEILKQVVSGQDDTDVLLEALTLIVKHLNLDNQRFAEFYLRPGDASRQGLEDIASGKPGAETPVTVTT